MYGTPGCQDLNDAAGGDSLRTLSSLNVVHGDIIELVEVKPPAPDPAPPSAPAPAPTPEPTPAPPSPLPVHPPQNQLTTTPSPPPRPQMSDEEYARQLYESDLSSMPSSSFTTSAAAANTAIAPSSQPIPAPDDGVRQADERRTGERGLITNS